MINTSVKERFAKLQKELKLNQKQLAAYVGVSIRTMNSWRTGDRECPDHVAELAERVAHSDLQAIKNDLPTSHMMRWAIVDTTYTDEFVTVYGSKADAVRDAEVVWNQLTLSEKKNRQSYMVALIKVQYQPDHDGPFSWAIYTDGSCDGDYYEVAKDYTEELKNMKMWELKIEYANGEVDDMYQRLTGHGWETTATDPEAVLDEMRSVDPDTFDQLEACQEEGTVVRYWAEEIA